MVPIDAKAARGIGFLLLYGLFFWRLIRSNRGDKFIQCGSITVMLFLALMALSRIPHFPLDDYAPWFAIPLFLLCVLTMFYLFQQLYREHKQRNQRRHRSNVAGQSNWTDRLLQKTCTGNGVAPLPFIQMVSNGVNDGGMDQTSDARARTDSAHETTIRF
jgi:hypothetical protein